MAVMELVKQEYVDVGTGVDTQAPSENFFGLKLTGVPRDATENDVRQFFNECNPTDIVMAEGGNVFVQLMDQEAFQKACLKDGHQLRWTKVGVLALTSRREYLSMVSKGPQVGEGEKDDLTDKEDESQYNVIRLRGLPYSATAADVLGFLKGVSVENGEKGVHFSSGSYGRSTGEVFAEVCSPEDVNIAMKYDREHMGGRYIEIFRSSRAQLEWECRGAEKSGGSGGVVRLRGLPYGCSADDIRDFMKGIAICENGITVQVDDTGRETGEAFIEVNTDRDVEKALDRHKKSIGHRYIEVFRTTRGDIKPVANRWASYGRPSPYPTRGRGGGGGRQFGRGGRGSNRDYNSSHGNSYNQHDMYSRGNQSHVGGSGDPNLVSYPPARSNESAGKHSVRMRGLPYSVTVRDIQAFYAPLIPINIVIERDESGRLSGEGEVSFGSHDDAVEAMRKDRTHIGSRYIELFLHSKNEFDRSQPTTGQHGYDQSSWTGGDTSSYTSFSSTDPRAQNRSQQYPQYQQTSSTGAVYDTATQQHYGGVQQQQYIAAQQQVLPTGAATYSQPPTQAIYQQQQTTPAAAGTVSNNSAYGYATQQQQAHIAGGTATTATSNAWY